MQARVVEQKMADLPEDKVFPNLPPFTHVRIDCFGPLEVKLGWSHVKRWGTIFTCLVSGSASSLDTDLSINASRRFMCRRGTVTSIQTDNGTNFVGAQKELKDNLKKIDNYIQTAILKDGVKWIFNPPFGAHYGGVWKS